MDRYNFRQQTRRRHFWGPDEEDEDLIQEHSFQEGPMTGAGYDMDLQYVKQLRIDQIEERAFRQVLEQFQRFPIETLCKADVYGVIEMAVREELMKHSMNYENDYSIRFATMAIPVNVIEQCMKQPKKVTKNVDTQKTEPEEEEETGLIPMPQIDWSAFQTEDEPSQIEIEMEQDGMVGMGAMEGMSGGDGMDGMSGMEGMGGGDGMEAVEPAVNPYEHIFKSYINVNPFVMQEEDDGSAMGGGRGMSS